MKKYLSWVILGILLITLFVIKPIEKLEMKGQNMVPTYNDGQILWMNNLAYPLMGKPQRGDVVVFNENRGSDHYSRVGRLIAIPGDAVKIQKGAVYLNNQQLNEPYAQGKTEILDPNVIAEGKEYTLNENEYFVLGDNRANSKYDSRSIGAINAYIEDVSNIHTFIEGKILSF